MKFCFSCQKSWIISVNPVLERLRQEDSCEFLASVGYTARPLPLALLLPGLERLVLILFSSCPLLFMPITL